MKWINTYDGYKRTRIILEKATVEEIGNKFQKGLSYDGNTDERSLIDALKMIEDLEHLREFDKYIRSVKGEDKGIEYFLNDELEEGDAPTMKEIKDHLNRVCKAEVVDYTEEEDLMGDNSVEEGSIKINLNPSGSATTETTTQAPTTNWWESFPWLKEYLDAGILETYNPDAGGLAIKEKDAPSGEYYAFFPGKDAEGNPVVRINTGSTYLPQFCGVEANKMGTALSAEKNGHGLTIVFQIDGQPNSNRFGIFNPGLNIDCGDLQPKGKSDCTLRIQQALWAEENEAIRNTMGADEDSACDSVFGPKTKKAIYMFQNTYGGEAVYNGCWNQATYDSCVKWATDNNFSGLEKFKLAVPCNTATTDTTTQASTKGEDVKTETQVTQTQKTKEAEPAKPTGSQVYQRIMKDGNLKRRGLGKNTLVYNGPDLTGDERDALEEFMKGMGFRLSKDKRDYREGKDKIIFKRD